MQVAFYVVEWLIPGYYRVFMVENGEWFISNIGYPIKDKAISLARSNTWNPIEIFEDMVVEAGIYKYHFPDIIETTKLIILQHELEVALGCSFGVEVV